MRTKQPKQAVLFNLEQYISQTDPTTGQRTERKHSTLAYQVPYGMAKGLADKAKLAKNVYGTFFKIVPNS